MKFLSISPQIISIALFVSFNALALPNDRLQPINIEADNASFNQKDGIASYSGNVVAKQGSIIIHAEELSITTNPDTGEFRELHATGIPSKFTQTLDNDGNILSAQGNTLDYDATSGELEIHQNGYLKHGQDEISADYIHYQLENEVFKAENRGNGRVNMTLQPTTRKAE